MRIRVFRPGDELTLCRIAADGFEDSLAEEYTHEGRLLFMSNIAPDVMAKRQAEDCQILIAERDGEIAGFMEMRDFRHISMLFVKRSHRRTGVATALLLRGIALALKIWGEPHEMTVFSAPGAEEFYMHHGFTPQGERQIEHGVPYRVLQAKLWTGSQADHENGEEQSRTDSSTTHKS